MEALSNPAVLTIVLGAFGGAITWLWSQISKAKTAAKDEIAKSNAKHQECEVELARIKAEMAAQGRELSVVQGTCATLTELLRKEVNLG